MYMYFNVLLRKLMDTSVNLHEYANKAILSVFEDSIVQDVPSSHAWQNYAP